MTQLPSVSELIIDNDQILGSPNPNPSQLQLNSSMPNIHPQTLNSDNSINSNSINSAHSIILPPLKEYNYSTEHRASTSSSVHLPRQSSNSDFDTFRPKQRVNSLPTASFLSVTTPNSAAQTPQNAPNTAPASTPGVFPSGSPGAGSAVGPSAGSATGPAGPAGSGAAPAGSGQDVMVHYPVDYFHYHPNYPPYYPYGNYPYYMNYNRSPSQVSPHGMQQAPQAHQQAQYQVQQAPQSAHQAQQAQAQQVQAQHQATSPNLKIQHVPVPLPHGSVSHGSISGPVPIPVEGQVFPNGMILGPHQVQGAMHGMQGLQPPMQGLQPPMQGLQPPMQGLQTPMQLMGQNGRNFAIPMYQYEENHALVNKRRIIKRRTRTGCLTCRKRRIKCDERKPQCFNCERSRKVCLGYESSKEKKGP